MPEGWGNVEVFSHTCTIGEVELRLFGLASKHSNGELVTGSAVEMTAFPIARSYFELLERASVSEAKRRPSHSYSVFGENREVRGQWGVQEVFPSSDLPTQWVYSNSNGCAVQETWSAAAKKARYELMERDALLRSWYGEFAPISVEIPPPCQVLYGALQEYYDFEVRLFPSSATQQQGVYALGVFGFPKGRLNPRVYGSAVAESVEEAITLANKEILQSLGFLWGESIPETLPVHSPTPSFHQEYFLYPESIDRVRAWLHAESAPPKSRTPSRNFECIYVDLTPPGLQSKICVVKAISENAIPLTFGGCPFFVHTQTDERVIHPFC